MNDHPTTTRHAFRTEPFRVVVAGRDVPALRWVPEGLTRRPLVLVGHGGSGHKDSQLVRDVALPLVEEHGFVVAAIDGPVHGERRATFADGPAVRDEFRELWARGASIAPMVADWRATLDALCALPSVDSAAIGWYGISMGTAYGLPFVAAEPRIRAAVLGMWGTCRVASEQLAEDAPKITVPVLFQRKSEDPLFTVEGQEDIFDRLGSAGKRLAVYPGGHTDPAGDQLRDILAFLVAELDRR
jgi:dienelactone hydrolase